MANTILANGIKLMLDDFNTGITTFELLDNTPTSIQTISASMATSTGTSSASLTQSADLDFTIPTNTIVDILNLNHNGGIVAEETGINENFEYGGTFTVSSFTITISDISV